MKKLFGFFSIVALTGTLFIGSYLTNSYAGDYTSQNIASIEIAGSGDCDKCEVSTFWRGTIFSCKEAENSCSFTKAGHTIRCNNAEAC